MNYQLKLELFCRRQNLHHAWYIRGGVAQLHDVLKCLYCWHRFCTQLYEVPVYSVKKLQYYSSVGYLLLLTSR